MPHKGRLINLDWDALEEFQAHASLLLRVYRYILPYVEKDYVVFILRAAAAGSNKQRPDGSF
jgi:hypothetical protein